jgi:hypothetical protein
MFTIILMLYLQQNQDVTLESAAVHGKYKNRAACEAAAMRLRGTVPIPRGYDAAWRQAVCEPVARNVRVNDSTPIELAKVLREQPASGCQAEGSWRRAAEVCERAAEPR